MSYISVPPGSPTPALQPLFELEAAPAAGPVPGQIRNALYRQRWLVLAVLVACVGLAAAASWWIRPYYVASGSIIITHPSLHNAELTPLEYPPPVDADRELQTQMTILESRRVAAPVIASLGLERRDPEIAHAIAGTERGAARRGRRLDVGDRADLAAAVFGGKLKLVPDKLSNTVHIEYGSTQPTLAAAVVNAVTAQYLKEVLAQRGSQGAVASSWMRVQVDRAAAELAQDDQSVADFQRENAYIPVWDGGGQQSGLLSRLTDATRAWSAAEAARISDQAAAESYAGGVVAALPTDLRNPAIDKASENVSAAEQQLNTLETTYRPDFPLVVEAKQQLDGARRQLAGLRTQVAAGLDQRLASSRERAAALGTLVAGLEQKAAGASGLEMRYGVLKSRAEAQRALVDTLRQKQSEVELEASLPPNNIAVLDRALPPSAPDYPKWPLDLGLGLVLGLAGGVGAALARERMGQQLTAGEAVKRGLGPALAPLGMIADRGRRGQVAVAGRGLLAAAPGEGPAPGYAKIAANLVARCGPPPRAILVTSANPGEGKTTTLCQVGRALAASGWRTLLVDADAARPGCHSFFGLPNGGGLQAAQSGRKVAPLGVAPHLDLMPAGEDAAQPLQPRALAGLLEQWREHYDYILVDSPSGNLGGEAVLLSALVEGVLVVLRWGHTRLPEAQHLCEDLARARAPLVGTLLNRADPRAPAYRAAQPEAA